MAPKDYLLIFGQILIVLGFIGYFIYDSTLIKDKPKSKKKKRD